MTLIDALAALQEGAVPTNEQIVAFLSRILLAIPTSKDLSPAGGGLVSDLRTVVESIDQIIKERNGNEELQEFLWRTRGAAGQLKKDGLKIRFGKGVEKKKSKGEKKEGGVKAKTVKAGQIVKRDGLQGEKRFMKRKQAPSLIHSCL